MDDDFKVDPQDKSLREIELLNMLAKAIGINYPVRRIKLDVGLHDVAHVVVESIVRDEQGRRVANVLAEEFDLVKKSGSVADIKAGQCRSSGIR